MATLKLTKTVINSLRVPDSGYQIYWDLTAPGFGVQVTCNGVKTYVMQARVHGKPKRFKIGRVGEILVETARERALEMRGRISLGFAPDAQEKEAAARRVTLATALEEYLAHRTSTGQKPMKDSTAADYRYEVGRYCKDLMEKPVAGLRREAVLKLHRKISETAPGSADKVSRYLRAVLNFAANQYLGADDVPVLLANPVNVLSHSRAWNNAPRRERVIQSHEMPRWFASVEATRQGDPWLADLLELLLFTGLRLSEALGLAWEDVDFTARTLITRNTKNHRDHVLPLSDFVLNLLRNRRAKLAMPSPWVFPARRNPEQCVVNPYYKIQQLTKKNHIEFSPHDLRRTYATAMEISGFSSGGSIYKRLMNHLTGRGDVSGGYVNLDIEQLRRPVNQVAEYLLSRIHPAEGNVVRLHREAG